MVRYGIFRHSRASNSEVNSPIWPEFELVRDFMAVLVTPASLTKLRSTILWTTVSPLQVYGKHFRRLRANNSKENNPIWPEIELVRDFMAVLVTPASLTKLRSTILWTTVSPLQVYGKHFRRLRANNSKENNPIWPEIELVWDFIAVLITCKFDKYPIQNEVAILRPTFPPFPSMGAFGCHGNQSFDQICPKCLCSLSPTHMMLHINLI